MAVRVGDRVTVVNFNGAAFTDAGGNYINDTMTRAYSGATGTVKKIDDCGTDPIFYVKFDDPAIEQAVAISLRHSLSTGCMLRHNLSDADRRKYYNERR